MAHNLARQRQPGGEQERRPVDGVLAQDLLADEVNVRGPVGWQSG